MKVTGYQLREAIKMQSARRDFAASNFADSLKAFPGETKLAPIDVMESLIGYERAIALLQVAQMRYNLAVRIEGQPSFTTLAQAIKLIGGVARAEKMWRGAATPKKADRYSIRSDDERNKDTIIATPTVSRATAHEKATALAAYSAKLREAIATANAIAVELDLDAGLLL